MARIMVGGGVGRVGSLLTRFLLEDGYQVVVVDTGDPSPELFQCGITFIREDLVSCDFSSLRKELGGDPDLIVNCLPGNAGFLFSRRIVQEVGIPLVDLSFYPEVPRPADFPRLKSYWIVDAGIAPGFSSMTLPVWHAHGNLVEWRCWVGGFPEYLMPPFYYQPTFSIEDVIAEYTRKARSIRDGQIIEEEPLDTVRPFLRFTREWGILCAFKSDGLRTLLYNVPESLRVAEEWTLRPCQHLAMMKLLSVSAGFEALKAAGEKSSGETPEVFLMLCEGIHQDGSRHELRVVARTEKPGCLSFLTARVCFHVIGHVMGREIAPGIYGPESIPDVEALYRRIIADFGQISFITVEERFGGKPQDDGASSGGGVSP